MHQRLPTLATTFCLALVLVLLASLPLTAQDRVALVIGNSDYAAVQSLENPRNDATDLADALRRLGFDVTLHLNLEGGATNRALRDFARVAETADMAVLYFAGHGMEIDNQNYLVPVDARIERALDVSYEANHMSQFLRAVSGAKTLRLVLLDACRNNPFLVQMADATSRSLNRGLAQIEPPGGVLVGYAAKGGTVALDGDARNSPYAAALLAHIEEPGLEIGKLFRRVRDTVYTATGGQQEPFTYGSLPARDIYLAAARPPEDDENDLLQAFARADIVNDESAWLGFLDRFETSGLNPPVIARAREKLAALRRRDDMPTGARTFDDSPLLRACDRLAGDPDDPQRPADVPGVALGDIDLVSARTACTLAVSGHPDHARSLYQLGRVLVAADETDRALRVLEQAVALNYIGAQIALGTRLVNANRLVNDARTEADRARGIALLDAATRAGSAVAPRILAKFYVNDRSGSQPGVAKAADLYELAARRGDAESQYQAGYRLLSNPLSTGQDRARAIGFLEQASAAGDTRAMVRLSNHYLSQKDETAHRKARSHLETAARDGDKYALARLIREHMWGTKWARDVAEAARWMEIGADDGNATMRVQLGYLHETGRGVPRDPDLAADHYIRALQQANFLPIQRASAEWDRDTVIALQQRLSRLGRARYAGPLDGVVGPGTRAAMQRLCNCSVPTWTFRFGERFGR